MTIAASDVSIAANGDIRWTGGATPNYTVLELHRFLQDLADDAVGAGNDLIDITSVTPSERSTDNIINLLGSYNIDDTLAEHLYDGSITQGAGNIVYSGLKVLGAVNNINTQLVIIQDNDLYQFTTTPETPFWGTQATGGYNGNAAAGILMRCLIKSRNAGVDIDGKRIRVQARHWGDSYDFFNVTLGQGEAVAAIGTTPDAQNTTAIGTVQAYTHISNIKEGYQTLNLNNGNGAQPYYSQWTFGANTSANKLKGVWEWIKELTSQASPSAAIYGLNGLVFLGVTHEVAISAPTGTFVEPEELSWGTGATAGTGQLLAINSVTAGTKIWMQLLTGVIPTGTITGAGGATATAGVVTSRTIPKVFLGSYTGSLIGAFGVGVKPSDLLSSDTVQDLLTVTQTPPNNVTFTVSAIVSGDRVLVGPKDTGNAFKYDQMTLNGALSGAEGTVTVQNASVPVDTPSAGTIRILGTDGVYHRVTYTGRTTNTFTGCTGAPAAANGANVFISYIDEAAGGTEVSFTTIYNAPRDLFVRVRDGGGTPIKTFESPSTLGSAGGSAVASRISDQ